jgi:hypothetical protein
LLRSSLDCSNASVPASEPSRLHVLPGIATLLTIRQRLLQIMTMTGVPVSHGLRSNPLNLSG